MLEHRHWCCGGVCCVVCSSILQLKLPGTIASSSAAEAALSQCCSCCSEFASTLLMKRADVPCSSRCLEEATTQCRIRHQRSGFQRIREGGVALEKPIAELHADMWRQPHSDLAACLREIVRRPRTSGCEAIPGGGGGGGRPQNFIGRRVSGSELCLLFSLFHSLLSLSSRSFLFSVLSLLCSFSSLISPLLFSLSCYLLSEQHRMEWGPNWHGVRRIHREGSASLELFCTTAAKRTT